jgi:hypothetical protein
MIGLVFRQKRSLFVSWTRVRMAIVRPTLLNTSLVKQCLLGYFGIRFVSCYRYPLLGFILDCWGIFTKTSQTTVFVGTKSQTKGTSYCSSYVCCTFCCHATKKRERECVCVCVCVLCVLGLLCVLCVYVVCCVCMLCAVFCVCECCFVCVCCVCCVCVCVCILKFSCSLYTRWRWFSVPGISRDLTT